MNLRGEVAIAGVAESELGHTPHLSPLDQMAQAALSALAEAGLRKSDIDGVFSTSAYYNMATVNLCEYLRIVPRYSDSTSTGGCAFVADLGHAAAAICSGLCEVALIAYGSTQRSDGGAFVSRSELLSFEEPIGLLNPISGYALAAQRHMYEYGTTSEQLAEVAVAARDWARLNPKAFMRDRLTVADVLMSPIVSSPLHKLDCCLVTDGGGAVVVTSAERARRLRTRPVYVLGVGESQTHRGITGMSDLTVTPAVHSGRAAFEMSGLGPGDMNFAQLYDAFTINTILFLEDLGFCPKGDGGRFVSGGRIAPGGKLPVNTNGGGLSYCHPGMYGIFTIIEAVRQLRGECGPRQIQNAPFGIAHGNGGMFSAQATCVLGREIPGRTVRTGSVRPGRGPRKEPFPS